MSHQAPCRQRSQTAPVDERPLNLIGNVRLTLIREAKKGPSIVSVAEDSLDIRFLELAGLLGISEDVLKIAMSRLEGGQ
jgi:hypothetical protein